MVNNSFPELEILPFLYAKKAENYFSDTRDHTNHRFPNLAKVAFLSGLKAENE
jgi:hypothetical protein